MRSKGETIKVCELNGADVMVDINSGTFSVEFGKERLIAASLRGLKDQAKKKKVSIFMDSEISGKSVVYQKYRVNDDWVWLVGILTGKKRNGFNITSTQVEVVLAKNDPDSAPPFVKTEWMSANNLKFGGQELADQLNRLYKDAQDANSYYEHTYGNIPNIYGVRDTDD